MFQFNRSLAFILFFFPRLNIWRVICDLKKIVWKDIVFRKKVTFLSLVNVFVMWIFFWGSVVVAITAWDVFYLESYLTPDPGSDGVERKYETNVHYSNHPY